MKRTRCDGPAGAAAAFHGAQQMIEPPEKLTATERKFWVDIIKTKALQDWTPNDLRLAVNLARTFALLAREHKNLSKAEDFDKAIARIEKLSRLTVALSSKLQLHAAATVGRADKNVARNTAQRQAGHILSGVSQFIKTEGLRQ